jgi:coenzyme F420-reducing hydrogenase beta subunit
MVTDLYGFKHPDIEISKCTGCSFCKVICPRIKKLQFNDTKRLCYGARSKDADLRKASSSGGIFTLIAADVINRGGVVYGAAFEVDTQRVRHIRIESINEISRIRGSKYVQSDLKEVFPAIFADVKSDRLVLFSGTPCQVAAVRNAIGSVRKNVILVDLICHGVPSPALFAKLLKEVRQEIGLSLDSKLESVTFRDKRNGLRKRDVIVKIGDLCKVGMLAGMSYYGAFLARLSIRSSCERCCHNNGRSGADITLGDFWGVEHFINDWDDNTGVSLVIVNSYEGFAEFRRLNVEMREVALSEAIKFNPSYSAPRKTLWRRKLFLLLLRKYSIAEAYKIINRTRFLEKICTLFKRIARRFLPRR